MEKTDSRTLPVDALNERRLRAVTMRLDGTSLTDTAAQCEMSRTTVIAAVRAYEAGGWKAVDIDRGSRPVGSGRTLSVAQEREVQRLIRDRTPDQLKMVFALWTRQAVAELIRDRYGIRLAVRTMGLSLGRWGFTPQGQTPVIRVQACQAAIHAIRGDRRRFKTITFDSGTEFHGYKTIEQATQVKCDFATPYHSWERGTNENTNGLIRQYLPKGRCMAHIPQHDCNRIQRSLNDRLRKRLGYQTPAKPFRRAEAVSHLVSEFKRRAFAQEPTRDKLSILHAGGWMRPTLDLLCQSECVMSTKSFIVCTISSVLAMLACVGSPAADLPPSPSESAASGIEARSSVAPIVKSSKDTRPSEIRQAHRSVPQISIPLKRTAGPVERKPTGATQIDDDVARCIAMESRADRRECLIRRPE